MSSNNNVMTIYQEIMEELSSKPMEIEFAQRTVMQRKAQLQNVTNQLDVMESNWVAGEGGYKAIGSNEKERDMRLMTLRNSFAFAPTMEVQRAATQSLDEAKIMAATLERQYEAICHKARLTTGILSYLGNLAMPVSNAIVQAASAQLFDLPGDASPAVTSATNGAVSILDAEAIGL